MPEEINRRHFLGAAAMTLAATQLGMIGSANERSTGACSGDEHVEG